MPYICTQVAEHDEDLVAVAFEDFLAPCETISSPTAVPDGASAAPQVSLYANQIHDLLRETQACAIDDRYPQHIRQNKPPPMRGLPPQRHRLQVSLLRSIV
jgi:hypothetical protein